MIETVPVVKITKPLVQALLMAKQNNLPYIVEVHPVKKSKDNPPSYVVLSKEKYDDSKYMEKYYENGNRVQTSFVVEHLLANPALNLLVDNYKIAVGSEIADILLFGELTPHIIVFDD